MSLVSLSLPKIAVDQILLLLERLVIAAEKLAGPDLPSHKLYKATEKDLLIATPGSVESRIQATAALVVENKLVPDSEAALAWMVAMENDIRIQMPGVPGEMAISELPWRKVIHAQDVEK